MEVLYTSTEQDHTTRQNLRRCGVRYLWGPGGEHYDQQVPVLALRAEHGGLGAHLAPVPAVQCTVQYSTGQYSAVQYLPVLATLSCARWRCVALLRLVSMLTPGRANTATAGLLEGRYR